jgi:hypothetical protein
MTPVLICLCLVILVSSALAWAWAKNRGWLGYITSTVCVWAGISAIPLFAPSAETLVLDQILGALVCLAPFAIVPMLILVPLVVRGAAVRTIIIASTVASIFAVPLTFFSGLYASCYVLHDCP